MTDAQARSARQRIGVSALIAIAEGAAATSPLPPVRIAVPPRLAGHVAPQAPGRHRQQTTAAVPADRHLLRLMIFGVVGGGVFLVGLVIQVALVRQLHMDAVAAYIAQGVASIQLSFLLNRYVTWRDRSAPFWRALWRFNTQKILMTAVNMAAYAGLVRFGVQYIAANIALTAVFTPVNYLLAHYWSFTSPAVAALPVSLPEPPLRAALSPVPTVSVVIPCKDSERTIRATVNALLDQDYPALEEVILVGSVGDKTWAALTGITDGRLVLLEQESVPGMRDPNLKRDKGIQKARAELIALVDSDIVMDRDWLTRAVALLQIQGGGLVAGGMRSIHNSFWGRFVDCNSLAAKTPRLAVSYRVTRENFGRHGRKPPITANVLFTRNLYDVCPVNKEWPYGYEDYEWFWRVARARHPILYSDALTGRHHHRRKLRLLAREYIRAGNGCARFIQAHPSAPLARKRLWQALLLPLVVFAALALTAVAVAIGYGPSLACAITIATGCLMGWEFSRCRTAESLAYPFISLPLAGAFTFSMARGLVQIGMAEPASLARAIAPRKIIVRRGALLMLATAISAGTCLRLWQLYTKPGWQVDEVTYTSLGHILLLHGTLNLPIPYSQPWTPFLFHPPFYFLVLARWFSLVGAGIYQARILGIICSVISFGLLARLLWKLHGPGPTTACLTLMAFDGWMLYIQRISYMENLLMVLVVGMFVTYRRALEKPQLGWFAAAGLLAGTATIFKHTGAYVLLAIVINWALVRRHHRQHLVALGVALTVVIAYVATMIHLFDYPGHDWYLQQTLVQVQRVLGLTRSKGTLSSPLEFLHLASRQYAVFLPSLLAATAGIVLLLVTLIGCLRRRSLALLKADTVIPSWTLAGVMVFGASSLRYAQYFALILIPAYCYLWTRLYTLVRARLPVVVAIAGMATILALNLWSFNDRVLSRHDNAFAQVKRYAQLQIPHNDVVIAESSIAYEIPQPWCSPYGRQLTVTCQDAASYIITWATYLQSVNPFHSKPLAAMLHRSVPVAKFAGFNGTVTVWRVQ
jgi:putative flippase GtrA/glycosyltransferase involved in cell wall biosynthesis